MTRKHPDGARTSVAFLLAQVLRAIGEVARAHNEAICFGLDPAERAALAALLQRIAARHELTPGVHPGYKDLRVAPK